jgi:4-aminobutyrate aminotransferase-like enzyme
VTRFPGAQHQEAIHSAGFLDQADSQQRFINFKASKGNYFVDTDGNTVLDMNASAAGQILGYNNDDLVNARSK